MAQNAVFLLRPSIEVEDHPRVVESDVAEDQTIAGLDGEAFVGDHIEVRFPGIQLAIGSQRETQASARKGAHGKALLRLQYPDQLQALLASSSELGSGTWVGSIC